MSFRIDPRLPLTAEVRRIAKDEIEGMLRHLASAPDSPDKAMHGCRKRIKRLRALLRLVRTGDPGFIREENARYRDISASLAGPREAAALIETIDRLADSFPEHAAAEAFEAMRGTLKARASACCTRTGACRDWPRAPPHRAGQDSARSTHWCCRATRNRPPTCWRRAPRTC